MDLKQAIQERHSVRRYLDKTLDYRIVQVLNDEIRKINQQNDFNIQLILNEPKAFERGLAHYGGFSNVSNYIAMIGPDSLDLSEKIGYVGEKLVLLAQQLGLNTCWVALTYKKIPGVFHLREHDKLAVIITIGYGENQGKAHKSKSITQVSNVADDTPEWFKQGVEAALLAPTAINQQQFYLTYKDGKVQAKAKIGPYANMDLGIIKYHFEIGSDLDSSIWL